MSLQKIKEGFEVVHFIKRVQQAENWIKNYGNPNIADSIQELESLVIENAKIYKKLLQVSTVVNDTLHKYITNDDFTAINKYIIGLDKNKGTINWYLHQWIPDLFGIIGQMFSASKNGSELSIIINKIVTAFKDEILPKISSILGEN